MALIAVEEKHLEYLVALANSVLTHEPFIKKMNVELHTKIKEAHSHCKEAFTSRRIAKDEDLRGAVEDLQRGRFG